MRKSIGAVVGGLAAVRGLYGDFASLGAAARWALGHHGYSRALVALDPPAHRMGAHLFTRRRP